MGQRGGLNFKVECAAKTNRLGIDRIRQYGDVDWYRWLNVKGTPQRVSLWIWQEFRGGIQGRYSNWYCNLCKVH